MSILNNVEPKKVFYYFEKLSSIPRGSTNTKAVSDYCVTFAEDKGYKYIQDESGNVVIFVPGTKDYEKSAPVIIQGHLDMVCECEEGVEIDFEKDPIPLLLKGNEITADGTTLGGDDGIAVAIGLALADSDDIPHPPLELVFTIDEEIGMLGAYSLDISPLKATTMINIDSEDEGYFTVGCAGGRIADIDLPLKRTKKYGTELKIKVYGLEGGHSGIDINKGRANANRVLARVLFSMLKKYNFNIADINGGNKDNAIPRVSTATICIDEFDELPNLLNNITETLRNEYAQTDKNISVGYEVIGESEMNVFDDDSTFKIISFVLVMPNGVQAISHEVEGLVETSLNLGILKTNKDSIHLSYLLRSGKESSKIALYERMEAGCISYGAKIDYNGDYPAWEFKPESSLIEKMEKIYREQYKKDPVVEIMHAGVECGIFQGKANNRFDIVSIGPTISDVHTPSETLYIDTVQRLWIFLKELLKELK